MAPDATTESSDDEPTWDGVPDRSPDLSASYEHSSYGRDPENAEFKQLTGQRYDSKYADEPQDFEKAAIAGDYALVTYTSKRSGGTVSRHGSINTGFHPHTNNGTLYISDQKSGKTLKVTSRGQVKLRNDNTSIGDGKKKRQKLGTVERVEVWFSEDRRENGLPFDTDIVQPGDWVQFELDGETRIHQVDGWANGGRLIHLDYPFDYEGDEDPSFIDPTGEYVETEMDGEESRRVRHLDFKQIRTLDPADKAVDPGSLDWQLHEVDNAQVTIRGYDDGDAVLERTFQILSDESRVNVDGDWVDAEDDNGVIYNHADANTSVAPDPYALDEVTDIPVRGADAE